jgi:hypothetical protein
VALKLSHGGKMPMQMTAWYHKADLTVAGCLALVRRHLWHARYLVNSARALELA